MNFQVAESYLNHAVVQRDCARWFEQRYAATGNPRMATGAASCRAQMRQAARRMVDHLPPRKILHELRALGVRQAARDITSASFSVGSAGAAH